MGKIYGYYEYDKSLTPGRSKDGGLSQLLFDSEGKLSDHASFHPEESEDEDSYEYGDSFPTDDADPEADAQAAALLVLAVIGAAAGGYALVRKATPHVQRMINARALPAVRSFWKKVRGQGSEDGSPDTDDASVAVVQNLSARADEPAPGVDVAVAVAKSHMSPDEWYARFRAMFEARQFADEQWTLLSSVQVAEDKAIAELQREMARNRPEAVVRRVTLLLKAAPEIDADNEAEPMPVELKCDPGRNPSSETFHEKPDSENTSGSWGN